MQCKKSKLQTFDSVGMTGITELEKITEEEKVAIDNDFDPLFGF